ncbi:MAG TPA: SdpI family protein [Smithella sp.]|jgi:uncharacterized membrane protein|nr:SdpI family protein [Smithella sp.]HNQ65178.1 SdpI family protein [Smithella sp.]HOE33098.1 SdpI family protein [Smithella sp.]HOO35363.1 SdpI family protein [Smithella sp.]HOX99425.1 SdpI family protein [Smithella sp.]
MPFKTLITVLICNFIFVMIAVPLALRKVPKNVIYGFRIKATLENDFVWYEANAYFGKVFIIGNMVCALLILILYFSDVVPAQNFVNIGMAILIIPALVAALLTFRTIKTKH